MPIYNERATVEEIIERVLAVPLRIELIAVDDASTDGSREIVQAWPPSVASSTSSRSATAGRGRRCGGGSPRPRAT